MGMHHRAIRRTLMATIYSLLIISLVLTGCKKSQPTSSSVPLDKDSAIRILMDQVITPSSLDHQLIAFTLNQPLPLGSQVSPYAPEPLPANVTSLPLPAPETLPAASWFFWIDDAPFAQFSHSSRFVFIDVATGKVKTVSQGWWPLVDGREVTRWIDMNERWNPINWAYCNVPEAARPKISGIRGDSIRSSLTLISLKDAGARQTAALPYDALPAGEAMVVVNGWAPGGGVDAGFNGDSFNATKFGSDSQIPVYRPHGKGLADIADAVKRAADAGANDIFFYWTGHGGIAADGRSFMDFLGTPVYPEDLATIFKKYPNIRFKVVIQGCFAGGFADTLIGSGMVEIFLSAASATESSYGDWDPQDDPNQEDSGSEFSSGLWEDLQNILNSPELQKRARDLAAERGWPEFVGWLLVARESALAKDSTFQAGMTHPVGRVSTPQTATQTPTPTATSIPTTKPTVTPPATSLTTTTTAAATATPVPTAPPTTATPAPTSTSTSASTSTTPVPTSTPPPTSTPVETTPTTIEILEPGMLKVPLGMSAESVRDDSGSRSTVRIEYAAHLVNAPGISIVRVVLKVNGVTWADSGPISVQDYTNLVTRQVAVGNTFDAQVIVTTSEGSTNTATGNITTPIP